MISLGLLAAAAGFSYLFYVELTKTAEITGVIPVGKVVEVQGQAQRRHSQHNRWGSLKGEEAVYDRDAIRTATGSKAVLLLNIPGEVEGERTDEITLGADTVIILDLAGEVRSIEFQSGDLSAAGSGGLVVRAEDTVVAVDDGAVILSREEGLRTEVSVTEGEATVESGGERTVLDTESVLSIDEERGETRKEQVLAIPTNPRPNSLLLTYGEKREVNFSWEILTGWENPVLEASLNPNFLGNDVFQANGDGATTVELSPGLWYWRLKEQNSNESGPVWSFSLEQERLPKPLAPAEGISIPFRENSPDIPLQWERSWFADAYRVEVASDPNFTNPVLNRVVNGSSLLISNLNEGDWWWRVWPIHQRGLPENVNQLPIGTFQLEQQETYAPVQLISPGEEAELLALDVRDGIPFRWKGEDSLGIYRIQVAQDPEFSTPIADVSGTETWKTLLPGAQDGEYWWRVEGQSSDGTPIPVSQTRRFTIAPLTGSVELLAPSPGGVEEWEPYAPYTFLWRSAVPGMARFLLDRVVNTRTGERSRIIESLVQGERYTAPIPGEGTYVWQVIILDNSGRVLTESPLGDFRLQARFAAPRIEAPRNGSTLDFVGETELRASWDPVPGALSYRTRLSGPRGYEVEEELNAVEQSFSLPLSAEPGDYVFEVTALKEDAPRQSETTRSSFQINRIVRYAPAIPERPFDGQNIDGLTVLRQGVRLSWRQNPALGRWTVELDNGEVTRLYQTTVPSLQLDGLTAGQYRWRVLSRDELGREAPEGPSAGFRIAELPIPSAPRNLRPGNGENVDMTGQNSLTFSWTGQETQNTYDLTIYSSDGTTALYRETGLRGNQFVLEDLSALSEGSFSWAVRASQEIADVNLVQFSPWTQERFTLSVNIGNQAPTILSEELQYAP
ncbi:MAG: FecR family protein [Spirochaetales bacterium]|nr:FecR family protein [Spirochaetales bacterium]